MLHGCSAMRYTIADTGNTPQIRPLNQVWKLMSSIHVASHKEPADEEAAKK